MRVQLTDLKRQYQLHKQRIDVAIHEVLDEGNFILGRQVHELETVLANYVESKHCIGVSSGTDSLQIALMALGVGHRDEVITVPFTWISTAEVIERIGAKPVFVDIEAETYTIDILQIEKAITSRTKAIMPVSLFGQMPDYQAINALAATYHLPVIEDGAQSFGATQQGKKSCAVTTIGSTSFFPTKPLGCYGDGGAIFTNDDFLAEKMRALRVHGGKARHHHLYLGMNARLDTLQAAILLAKFPYFQEELKSRSRLGARYSELLKEHCTVPKIWQGNSHTYAQYTIRIPHRDQLASKLGECGIPTGIYYPKCLHEQPVFNHLPYKKGSFPIAEKASREVLSLPMHAWLSEEDQNLVVQVIQEFVKRIIPLPPQSHPRGLIQSL